MIHTINGFARADAVGIVGIRDVVKGLELPSLFPCQCVTEVGGRVALRVVCDRLG